MADASQDLSGPRYAIRTSIVARNEIGEAVLRFADVAGEEVAREWYEGLLNAIAGLAQNPRRFSLTPEEKHFRRQGLEVRQILYRRTSSAVAYRVLFSIVEEGPDGPQVQVFHVRHAARRPLTMREARDRMAE